MEQSCVSPSCSSHSSTAPEKHAYKQSGKFEIGKGTQNYFQLVTQWEVKKRQRAGCDKIENMDDEKEGKKREAEDTIQSKI